VRFDLVDRVLELTPDRVVIAKCVTAAEEYLADHFPSFPVLPGVMMLETLIQAGRRLLSGSDESAEPLVLAEARNVRYGNMVRPGQTLVVEVTRQSQASDGGWELNGVGKVEGQVAVQARFRLAPVSHHLGTA
jgi:3-hydroxyacyl-[acyl-carrier-protein] dehydratase